MFLSNVGLVETAGKGWEAHFTPYIDGRSFTMIVSDLVTVYASYEVGILNRL
jgi:hypothetical protein